VVDPDMLQFEDGATVSCQFQAHTFEDRVLKIDRVRIRRRATVGSSAVLLYGADIGAGTHVAPHSVVMKRESLLPGRAYSGCPTQPVSDSTPIGEIAFGVPAAIR
jgi:acetyltransferase-like isoleucine patch superfamily enzyme